MYKQYNGYDLSLWFEDRALISPLPLKPAACPFYFKAHSHFAAYAKLFYVNDLFGRRFPLVFHIFGTSPMLRMQCA